MRTRIGITLASLGLAAVIVGCNDRPPLAPGVGGEVAQRVAAQAGDPRENPRTVDNVEVGVYYMPFFGSDWNWDWAGRTIHDNYTEIDRMPELRWYDSDLPAVVDAQLLQMYDAGIDYVVHDWYWQGYPWGECQCAYWEGSLIAHRDSSQVASDLNMRFAIHWANGVDSATLAQVHFDSMGEFDAWISAIVHHWSPSLGHALYYQRPARLTPWGTNRKLPVFVYPEVLRLLVKVGERLGYASSWGPVHFLAQSRLVWDSLRGLAPQLYFVGLHADAATDTTSPRATSIAAWGFDAVTAYLYAGDFPNWTWTDVANNHDNQWSYIQGLGSINPILSVAPGYDGRPRYPTDTERGMHTTPFQWEALFRRAISTSNSKDLVICCFNEWGEGAVIEASSLRPDSTLNPLYQQGTGHLDAVRRALKGTYVVAAYSSEWPRGGIDSLANGVLYGWATDDDTPNRPIMVALYVDGTWPSGTHEQPDLTANYAHPLYPNDHVQHGFRIPVPSQYLGPGHTLYVYGLDPSHNMAPADSLNPLASSRGWFNKVIGTWSTGYPPEAYVSGSDVVPPRRTCTFTGSASGGTEPYAFAWYVDGQLQQDGGHKFDWWTALPYTLQLRVTDHLGQVGWSDLMQISTQQGASCDDL